MKPRVDKPGSRAMPDPRSPYLFAYDVCDEARARKVRRCLQRWRVDGQYSVHEIDLMTHQAQELTAEVVDLLDRQADRLLVARLSQRGGGPVHVLSKSPKSPPLLGRRKPQPLPQALQAGWYLLAYDITDPQRLQQVQRAAAEQCSYTQRSVYIYDGAGTALQDLLSRMGGLIQLHVDDLRLYCINGPQDLWFPSGPPPPLAALATQSEPSVWQKLRKWVGIG